MRGRRAPSLRLLPLGAGPRLLGAALIVAALWGAFFWATSAPGGSPLRDWEASGHFRI